jgi:AraC family transcriptional regulator
METGVLSVKNMVCHRCILAVESLLDKLAIPYQQVIAGEVVLVRKLVPEESDQFATQLSKIGLELINTKANGMVEKIKQLVIKKARGEVSKNEQKLKLSTYLSQHLFHEYTYLSSYFSSLEGRTIESYFIQQRIEKVKELLLYNEMTLSAISYEMDYSSVAHLSYQFKQITGVTPSEFKKSGSGYRKLLDQI